MKLVALSAVALATAGAAYGAGKPGIFAQPLGAARIASPYTVAVTKPGDLVFVQAKIAPGATFGWHTHSAAVVVAVVAGTFTLYDSSDPTCAPRKVSAGQGFVEQPNHIHLGRNEGTKPVRVMIAYLSAPHGKPLDRPAARPSQCTTVR